MRRWRIVYGVRCGESGVVLCVCFVGVGCGCGWRLWGVERDWVAVGFLPCWNLLTRMEGAGYEKGTLIRPKGGGKG
jgi:hypothetical protein